MSRATHLTLDALEPRILFSGDLFTYQAQFDDGSLKLSPGIEIDISATQPTLGLTPQQWERLALRTDPAEDTRYVAEPDEAATLWSTVSAQLLNWRSADDPRLPDDLGDHPLLPYWDHADDFVGWLPRYQPSINYFQVMTGARIAISATSPTLGLTPNEWRALQIDYTDRVDATPYTGDPATVDALLRRVGEGLKQWRDAGDPRLPLAAYDSVLIGLPAAADATGHVTGNSYGVTAQLTSVDYLESNLYGVTLQGTSGGSNDRDLSSILANLTSFTTPFGTVIPGGANTRYPGTDGGTGWRPQYVPADNAFYVTPNSWITVSATKPTLNLPPQAWHYLAHQHGGLDVNRFGPAWARPPVEFVERQALNQLTQIALELNNLRPDASGFSATPPGLIGGDPFNTAFVLGGFSNLYDGTGSVPVVGSPPLEGINGRTWTNTAPSLVFPQSRITLDRSAGTWGFGLPMRDADGERITYDLTRSDARLLTRNAARLDLPNLSAVGALWLNPASLDPGTYTLRLYATDQLGADFDMLTFVIR